MHIPDIPLNLRRQVWSFSSLNCYLNICPAQFNARYVEKTAPFEGSAASRYGDEVHAAMEARIGKGTPLPEAHATFEPFASPFDQYEGTAYALRVEEKLGMTEEGRPCDFWGRGVWLRGKLDVSLVAPDYKTAYIFDIKTGRVWEKPLELEIFALLLKVHHPSLERIVGQYAWLKEGKLGKMHDVSDTASTLRVVRTAVAEIERDKGLGQWEKREGPLCAWCPVKSCEFNRS